VRRNPDATALLAMPLLETAAVRTEAEVHDSFDRTDRTDVDYVTKISINWKNAKIKKVAHSTPKEEAHPFFIERRHTASEM
jgi:hypothetical protein